MKNCPIKCPYKKDGKCSEFVSSKNDYFLFFSENQCPYYENTVSSSVAHKFCIAKSRNFFEFRLLGNIKILILRKLLFIKNHRHFVMLSVIS